MNRAKRIYRIAFLGLTKEYYDVFTSAGRLDICTGDFYHSMALNPDAVRCIQECIRLLTVRYRIGRCGDTMQAGN